ncbi:MAG: hypothetical protein LBR66_08945 [Candidatus Symbiothrix sp.]|jgi:hypothetical protein|nr:hypothetical protein [Candidatus Symbiothrix sp.]
MATNKKVTRVASSTESSVSTPKWTPTAEAKGRASKNRLIAVGLWVLAILAQIVGIMILVKNPTPLTTGLRVWLIVALVIDLIFLIIGSSFWKKANRLDPASKQNALAFTIQSQAGVGVAVLAFLPVVILAFIKKEYIVGAIATALMIGGGAASADYHAPSVEEYTEQTNRVEELTGGNHVYWTKSGKKYHLYNDCSAINTNKTDEIFEGTVAQARELKNITELCKFCENRAEKAKGIATE